MLSELCSLGDVRGARRTGPPADPRPAAGAPAAGRGADRRAGAEPAGHVQAPAGAARRRARPGAPGGPAPLVRAGPAAARRDRRLAGAVPVDVGRPVRRPRAPPRRRPRGDTVNDRLSSDGSRSVLRMQRRLAHPPERMWAALTESDRLAEWFPTTMRAELR